MQLLLNRKETHSYRHFFSMLSIIKIDVVGNGNI